MAAGVGALLVVPFTSVLAPTPEDTHETPVTA